MARSGPERFELKDGREVVIRSCEAADAPQYGPYTERLGTETTHMLVYPGRPPRPETETAERYAKALEAPTDLFLGVFHEGRLVGSTLLEVRAPAHPWIKHTATFGMGLLRDFWGHGIATRLLTILDEHARRAGITRIEAQVRTRNERGVALYKKCGYEIEGTRRRAALIDGEWQDEYWIAKLL